MRDFLENSNVCLIYLSKVSIILYDISKKSVMCRSLTKGNDANVINTSLLTIYIHISY